jgi:hypothetical protein
MRSSTRHYICFPLFGFKQIAVSVPSSKAPTMTLKLSLYGLVITFILALTTLVEAKCVNPAVRREWRSLSRTQQKNYMDAAKVRDQ